MDVRCLHSRKARRDVCDCPLRGRLAMSMNQFLTRSSGVTTHVDGASSNVCLARSLALAFQVRASAFLAVHMARLLRNAASTRLSGRGGTVATETRTETRTETESSACKMKDC
jgi:hypothetical protein